MCPNCHAPTRAGDAFCTSCGAALRLWPVGQAPPGGQEVEQRQADQGPQYGEHAFPGPPPSSYSPPEPYSMQDFRIGQQFPPAGPQQAAGRQVPQPPGKWPASSPSGAQPSAQQFHPDISRLGRAELLVGGATVILMVAIFMPWFRTSPIGPSQNGLSAHSYLVLALLSAAALLAYLVLLAGWDSFPLPLPITRVQVLLFGAGLQLLLVLPGFLFKPGGSGWAFGSYLSLLCAMVACGGACWPAVLSLRLTGQPHPQP